MVKLPDMEYTSYRHVHLRLDIELARLGSAQLELVRYDNELALLGSLSDRAESQARLGSFGSSSWLVWLTSQLKKSQPTIRARA